ncbi:MAG TPA: hypothetical protein DD723_04215 [Candidatus Omnitrophica bacterium]|nr:MAG: hypothetical protein A2Z81_02835 [Omnitrophica WOR_2 bacterium GWA2_45_18]OGX18606.1 MAG: hypothetical protein A2Y04_03775 [Omnitrophica WOR_2 bacterium GWC2_45_7]HBR14736.1 hypothetical protein [Candidatus Omnitrophota bacterium]
MEKNRRNKLQKKKSRVAKLSQGDIPHGSKWSEGFFVHLIDFTEALVSFKTLGARQKRMRMAPTLLHALILKSKSLAHLRMRSWRK